MITRKQTFHDTPDCKQPMTLIGQLKAPRYQFITL